MADSLNDQFRFGGYLEVDVQADTVLDERKTRAARVVRLLGSPGAPTSVTFPVLPGGDWVVINDTDSDVTINGSITITSGESAYAVTDGASWWKSASYSLDSPGPIGSTTPDVATFTDVTLTGGSVSYDGDAEPSFAQFPKTQAAGARNGSTWVFGAQDGRAGSSIAGAAKGGGFEFTTGAAQRLTSGNQAGGSFTITLRDGVGNKGAGFLNVRSADADETDAIALFGYTTGADVFAVYGGGARYAGHMIGLVGSPPNLGRAVIGFEDDADQSLESTQIPYHILDVRSDVPLTATRDLFLPLADGAIYTVKNATSGGQSVRFRGVTGTGVTVANGSTARVWSDGTNYYQG